MSRACGESPPLGEPARNPACIANPNLTRATEAGKEGGGETETSRTGTRYEAPRAGKVAKSTAPHRENRAE